MSAAPSVVQLALDVWLGLAYLAGLGVAIGVALVGNDRAAAMARLAEPPTTTDDAG
jgi:F0F1-type ATP synthase membrane subunit c/vacuolar-type H+-ATPase subunit K